jgi:hypothetical protein
VATIVYDTGALLAALPNSIAMIGLMSSGIRP